MHEPTSMEKLIADQLAAHLPLGASEVAELIQTPPEPDMGDYGLPCFTLTKYLHKAPNEIAEELAASVDLPEGILKAQTFGPYLNFFADRALMTERVLTQIQGAQAAYGQHDLGAGKTVVVEYGSPNIAKHLGIHHLPSAAIGRSLCQIFKKLGYNCVSVNFLGDWGTSFGRLIAAVERYADTDAKNLTISDLQDLYVRYTGESKLRPEMAQSARDAFARLESGEERATRLWSAFKSVSLEEFDRVYGMLGISFDRVTPESFYRDRIEDMLTRLREQGVAVESAGALIVLLDDFSLPPCMVQKSDGASLYATRDIPAAEHRWNEYEFDRSLYVVGNEQALYFKQLRAVLKKMGHEWADRIAHVNFGLIKFRDPETGQARIGSTRRGEMLLLEDVLSEAVSRARGKIEENLDRFEDGLNLDELAAQVGIGAVVFRQLATRRMRDVVFDWDRMLDFEGDTGPYVQYAHARLCSILRKAPQAVQPDVDFSRLGTAEEWVLVRHLQGFPAAVRRAAQEYEPSIIASYLLELCADFSTYYSAGMRESDRRVLCDDAVTRAARLLLVDATRHVIRNGLDLLGIAAPERM